MYLAVASELETTGGTILIRNDGKAENVAYTPIPAVAEADEPVAFKQAKLDLQGAAKVRLYANLQMSRLSLANGTQLDLNGTALKVKRAKLGAASLKPGTYKASDAALMDFVTDSSEGKSGTLEVTGCGIAVVVR